MNFEISMYPQIVVSINVYVEFNLEILFKFFPLKILAIQQLFHSVTLSFASDLCLLVVSGLAEIIKSCMVTNMYVFIKHSNMVNLQE